jgi:hypothetical protein
VPTRRGRDLGRPRSSRAPFGGGNGHPGTERLACWVVLLFEVRAEEIVQAANGGAPGTGARLEGAKHEEPMGTMVLSYLRCGDCRVTRARSTPSSQNTLARHVGGLDRAAAMLHPPDTSAALPRRCRSSGLLAGRLPGQRRSPTLDEPLASAASSALQK